MSKYNIDMDIVLNTNSKLKKRNSVKANEQSKNNNTVKATALNPLIEEVESYKIKEKVYSEENRLLNTSITDEELSKKIQL